MSFFVLCVLICPCFFFFFSCLDFLLIFCFLCAKDTPCTRQETSRQAIQEFDENSTCDHQICQRCSKNAGIRFDATFAATAEQKVDLCLLPTHFFVDRDAVDIIERKDAMASAQQGC